jgi:restriction system protein
LQAHTEREAARSHQLDDAREQYHQQVFAAEAAHTATQGGIEELKRNFAAGVPTAVSEYFLYVLQSSIYPDGFPNSVKVAYVPGSRQLVVEKDLPSFEVVPDVSSYKYVKARDEIASVACTTRQRKDLYGAVIAQVTLRTVREIFEADRTRHIDSVVFNGYVEAIDPGSGSSVRPCVVTLRTTQDAFARLNLHQVDPVACLRTLNAGVSRSPAELAPVRPVLEFNMVDPRFIQESDVLSSLDERPNLMELSPGEFESLITNLFEKMGLETRLTQASRDGGVDCVAYDTRPIFGGKVVIQAKRYKHTVGVSAVRDLFGTVQNEGASKGILVTTSGYGKAAFDFASGKPLELLSGEHLLYLLKEHAGLDAKIEVPPTWRDPVPDSSDD